MILYLDEYTEGLFSSNSSVSEEVDKVEFVNVIVEERGYLLDIILIWYR